MASSGLETLQRPPTPHDFQVLFLLCRGLQDSFGTLLLLWTKKRKNLVTNFCQKQSPAPGERRGRGSSIPDALLTRLHFR